MQNVLFHSSMFKAEMQPVKIKPFFLIDKFMGKKSFIGTRSNVTV